GPANTRRRRAAVSTRRAPTTRPVPRAGHPNRLRPGPRTDGRSGRTGRLTEGGGSPARSWIARIRPVPSRGRDTQLKGQPRHPRTRPGKRARDRRERRVSGIAAYGISGFEVGIGSGESNGPAAYSP